MSGNQGSEPSHFKAKCGKVAKPYTIPAKPTDNESKPAKRKCEIIKTLFSFYWFSLRKFQYCQPNNRAKDFPPASQQQRSQSKVEAILKGNGTHRKKGFLLKIQKTKKFLLQTIFFSAPAPALRSYGVSAVGRILEKVVRLRPGIRIGDLENSEPEQKFAVVFSVAIFGIGNFIVT